MTKREPNFLIGGTGVGGTSFLAAALVQHPEIYLPNRMRPEPHYFYKSWEFAKGYDNYLTEWFSDVPETAIAVGERSSSYLYGGTPIASRIRDALPDIKFVFTLRNPLERAWANYRNTVLQGLEDLSFMEALTSEAERMQAATGIWAEIQPNAYIDRGFYGKQLSEFSDYFDAEQMLCIKSETLSKQTRTELQRIYRFLNLTNLDFMPEVPPDHTSSSVRDPALQMRLRQYFGTKFDLVIEATRKDENVEQYIESAEDREAIEELRQNLMGEKKPMPEDCRRYLSDVYRDDIAQLSELVDFPVDDWV